MREISQKISWFSKHKKTVQEQNEKEKPKWHKMHMREWQQIWASARGKIGRSREGVGQNRAAEKKPGSAATQARCEDLLEQWEMIKIRETTGDGVKKEGKNMWRIKKTGARAEKQHQEPGKWNENPDSRSEKQNKRTAEPEKNQFHQQEKEIGPWDEKIARQVQKKTRQLIRAGGRLEDIVLIELKKTSLEVQRVNSWANHVKKTEKPNQYQMHRDAAE